MCPRRSFSIHQGFFVAAYSTKTILFCWSILDGTFAKNGRNNDNLICFAPIPRIASLLSSEPLLVRPFRFFFRATRMSATPTSLRHSGSVPGNPECSSTSGSPPARSQSGGGNNAVSERPSRPSSRAPPGKPRRGEGKSPRGEPPSRPSSLAPPRKPRRGGGKSPRSEPPSRPPYEKMPHVGAW